MSKYVALLIDTLNHDQSISDLLNPTETHSGSSQKIRSDLITYNMCKVHAQKSLSLKTPTKNTCFVGVFLDFV